MECTCKNGGRMLLHWTHQNGKSVDFMTPVKRGDESDPWTNNPGLVHYLFGFNEHGKFLLDPGVEIDFEIMARHILAVDDAAAKNGMRIRKILFHTSLQDELFSTPSGGILVERDINFVTRVSDLVNRFHDDHYHIDFEFLQEDQ
jgi:penicillin-insensitive murein endopeptidase